MPVRPSRWLTLLPVLLLLASPLLVPRPALAGLSEEAARQVELAEEDLAAGNFERAAASAASALRLDPGRTDALVVRALALKGLGRLEDAAGLLRAYRDLRGSLPLDERVEPALAEIARLLAPAATTVEPEEPEQEAPSAISGPVTVVFTPEGDPRASERAYEASLPFLGGTPATSIQRLGALLPQGDGLVVLGGASTPCAGDLEQPSPDALLTSAESAVIDLDPSRAEEAALAAERVLACGPAPAEPSAVGRLLAVRAAGRWMAGEPEVASRLWAELFALQPERLVGETLSPTAQAMQLDAKLRARKQVGRGELSFLLPAGWTATLDGRGHAGGGAPPGRRIVRVEGPEGESMGAVVELPSGGAVTVATVAALGEAVRDPRPEGVALRWLSVQLAPVLVQGARGVLLVNLSSDPPVVRHFDGQRFLVLTPGGGAAKRTPRREAGASAVPRGASAALLGGGLAAAAVGVIVAVLGHRDARALGGEMGTISSWVEHHDAYGAALGQERAGTGVAVGGGVVAALGAITFAIPQPRAKGEVANR